MKACQLIELSLSHRLQILIGIGAQGFVYFCPRCLEHICGVLPAAHGNERVCASVNHELRCLESSAALGLRRRVRLYLARFRFRIMKIVQKLSDTLCTLDSANQDTYKANTKTYLAQLQKLDDDFRQVIDNSKRKEIIVGDRFPFRYFCEEYGLTYYAAFPGCSTDTEADASTVAFLIKKVKEDQIPVVFHIELSNEQMCDSICEATGAKSELLNAVHNVSDSDFKAGVTYVSLMEHNVEVLKEALN